MAKIRDGRAGAGQGYTSPPVRRLSTSSAPIYGSVVPPDRIPYTSDTGGEKAIDVDALPRGGKPQ